MLCAININIRPVQPFSLSALSSSVFSALPRYTPEFLLLRHGAHLASLVRHGGGGGRAGR